MAEEMNAVDTFRVVGFLQKTVLHLARHGVNAADGRQDPQLVAHPDFTVGATINLDVAIRRLRGGFDQIRLIAVRVEIA